MDKQTHLIMESADRDAAAGAGPTWHLVGHHWHEGAPALAVRPWPGSDTLVDLPLGGTLELALGEQRYCVGWTTGGGLPRHPCPTRRELAGLRGHRCPACTRRWTFRLWLSFDGTPEGRAALPPEVAALCERDYVVYLASFGAGQIKVGISVAPRLEERLLEQGALAALVVASADGYTARRLERAISATGVPERMGSTRKVAGMAAILRDPDLEPELAARAEAVRSALAGEPAGVFRPERYLYLVPRYGLQELDAPPVRLRATADLRLAGEVRAVAGGLAIVQEPARPEQPVALDLRTLAGYLGRVRTSGGHLREA